MTVLPRSLAAWSDDLAALAPEFGELLGPWLPRLERLRGAVALSHPHADGEPDGLSGLNRRGLYERLVATEWSLLESAPDEFVRRAGSGEHLFLEIARADSAGAGRVVALFDAGPWQLGAPRLAHLAWLLVLARHARQRGVHFAWGVLQAPEAGLRESIGAGDIRALMAARTREAVSPDAITSWAAELGPAAKREERWLITHARDERVAGELEAFTLAIAEADDAGSTLALDAASRGGLRGKAVLPLPPPRACGRLLRDPVRGEPPGPARSSLGGERLAAGEQVVFSATSPHVLVRLESGEIVGLALRLSEDGRTRATTRFVPPRGTVVVAAGWRKGRMYVFTSDGETLVLHSSRAGRWSAPRPFASMSGGALPFTSPGVLGRLFVDGEGARIWFCDERWRMHCADLPTLTVNREGGQVVAWGSLLQGSGVAFVQRSRDDRLELRTRSPKGGGTDVLGGRAFRLSRGFVVAVTRAGVPSFVALGAGDGEWQLLAPSGRTDKLLRLSADLPVYGAALIGAQQCLLVGDRAREMLNFVDGERVVSSVTLPDEVDFACLHSNGHWIAAQVAGGLCVVDRRGRELLRWGGPWL